MMEAVRWIEPQAASQALSCAGVWDGNCLFSSQVDSHLCVAHVK